MVTNVNTRTGRRSEMKMEKVVRARSTNMSNIEKHTLTDLCVKYKNMIDNKQTDAVSNKSKESAWLALAVEFNAVTTAGVCRSASQLKHVRIFISYAYKLKLG